MQSPVILILSGGDPGVLTSSLSGNVGVQMCTDPPLFSAMLLYMTCNPYYQFCRQCLLNSACTLISVGLYIFKTSMWIL